MGFSSKTGISLASGFKYQAQSPLDLRRVVDTIAERNELVTINAAWEGMHVYVKTDKKTYEYRGELHGLQYWLVRCILTLLIQLEHQDYIK